MFTEFGEKLGFHIVHQSPQQVEMTMPVEGNRQIVGLLHGGATAALIEEAGSRLALELAQPGMVPAGTELSVSHVASAQGDEVCAIAELLHRGKKNCVVQVRVCDGPMTVAIGRITCVYIAK
ncbi:PaaI family thioesterase [Arcanobacterium canis]|uniref:PaaI family thioesterase n=1 Tax=Arcanobacterium canis TaxID=999183 RepID=A0ABY8G1K7_9ACTO|nr:PaaI family thioesterase [Arcanobacterium canis]WFM84150.1 PaaI family thioesterase [Arcanobacterium canis]